MPIGAASGQGPMAPISSRPQISVADCTVPNISGRRARRIAGKAARPPHTALYPPPLVADGPLACLGCLPATAESVYRRLALRPSTSVTIYKFTTRTGSFALTEFATTGDGVHVVLHRHTHTEQVQQLHAHPTTQQLVAEDKIVYVVRTTAAEQQWGGTGVRMRMGDAAHVGRVGEGEGGGNGGWRDRCAAPTRMQSQEETGGCRASPGSSRGRSVLLRSKGVGNGRRARCHTGKVVVDVWW